MKDASGNPDALVLIDQEGGRVARLRPPHWPIYPPGATYGALWRIDPALAGEAAFLGARLIADDLASLGINVDCLPVLDVPVPGAHDVIGDRAYGREPHIVMALGRAAADGLLEGHVLPIIKHIPGHGRAMADSHHDLPRVKASRTALQGHDFPPFRALGDLDLSMTAHVVYEAFDLQEPATTSQTIIRELIRRDFGFDGLLMSDDLSMKALSGSMQSRRQGVLGQGCDLVLHCNGEMSEMLPTAEDCPDIDPKAQKRLEQALARLRQPPRLPFDRGQARNRLDALLAMVA
jgi:beta-N-acetylhexosaminidase